MNQVNPQTSDSKPQGVAPAARGGLLSAVLSDTQFGVVCIILMLTAIGWYSAISALELVMLKEPVPWPSGVKVTEDFRLASLPGELGSYKRSWILKPGVASAESDKARENVLADDVRETLQVGLPTDAAFYRDRASNWYVSRYYTKDKEYTYESFDKAYKAGPIPELWNLDVTYYTGMVDQVAHVPGRCMVASGATPTGEDQLLEIQVPASAKSDWKKVSFVRSVFEKRDQQSGSRRLYVQYYTFSVNGENEHDWMTVRRRMSTNPLEKHVYFAKIQFAPLAIAAADIEEMDNAARAFAHDFLPAVLDALPSAQAVEELNKRK